MGAPAMAILLGSLDLALAAPSLAQDANADHYRKVDEVVQIASEVGCASAVAVLHTRYNVRNARCVPELLKTSLPAKVLLTFTLEGRPYHLYVTRSAGRRGEARSKEAVPK